MAVVDVKPLVLKDVVLTLSSESTGASGDDFRKHVSNVTFTPTATSITWTGLGLNAVTDVATATWTVALTYAQDWTSTTSLSKYLFENEGESVEMTFAPKSGGPTFTANVVISPGAVGGEVNAFATATVTLGCDKPVFVPAS